MSSIVYSPTYVFYYVPTAAIIPGMSSASLEAFPLEYAESIICSIVTQPSA